MNTRDYIVAVTTLALCCLSHVAAAELKIGVVNVNRLLEESPQAISAQKRLEKEFAPRDRKLLAEQQELKEIEDEAERDSAMVSEAERGRSERDLRARKRDLRRAADELREDKTIRMNEELAELQRIVNEAIRDIGKKEDYDLILYEGIIFVNPKINLTEQVLERLKTLSSADAAKK